MDSTKRILVGEDSSVIINLTKSVLSFENYEIKSAKDGTQVLDLLQNEDFDLVLMDISMPKMDGIECTKAIRNLPDQAKASIPIIAITGNLKNFTKEQYKTMGFTDFLQKPLNYDLLLATVKKIINK
ncbi:response regulator [Algoriphagus sediminis]|uniref:Response regulator n=1 Tax=Algoriphagus sediminis TaxID=3057113 RepID=A0ABT7Y7R5_9BACT|nr:response regulator [Algoriphagus sediminis]MDN3202563.1 response regulator [Algoriphagus sediminis]